jgi:hypothetical protein
MPESRDILSALHSNFVLRSLSTSAIALVENYKPGAAVLAADTGADESAFTARRKKLPKGYDSDYKSLVTALNACKTFFRDKTHPFGMGAGKTKDGDVKAKGDRLQEVRSLTDGSFDTAWATLERAFEDAREQFAQTLPYTLSRLSQDQALGRTFDHADYPSPDEIRMGFTLSLSAPRPLPSSQSLDGLALTPEWRQAISDDMARTAEAQIKFSQQATARELSGFVQNVASVLARLQETANDPTAKRTTPIHLSLIQNVRDACDKLAAIALPETEDGSKLREMVERIRTQLVPPHVEADTLKASPGLVTHTQKVAASLAQALDNLELFQ